jgi:uncharacterized protein DUF4326
MPKRIQRRRTKGWRMPEGVIYVGRPTIFGNPFPPSAGLEAFETWLLNSDEDRARRARTFLPILRGVDLACWCNEDSPCHADILLRLANS